MIVLDTHTLVWWVSGAHENLSQHAMHALKAEEANGKMYVSSISAWELARLVDGGRLGLGKPVEQWLEVAAAIPTMTFVAIDNQIAIDSITLPGEFHRDPADRFIVATARKLSAPLVTIDRKIRAYSHVRTIW